VKKVVRSHHEPALDTSLRTGSAAPNHLSGRKLEVSIGYEVRRQRESIDLTVAELGAAADISAGTLSKIENGSISASLGTLHSLARALNVPITQLFSETDERRRQFGQSFEFVSRAGTAGRHNPPKSLVEDTVHRTITLPEPRQHSNPAPARRQDSSKTRGNW
jgi:transcriptional regulator with XRE-family HTH domain